MLATPPLFARWVEVQTRDTVDLSDYVKNLKENDLWLALFPLHPKQDAVARITNVSPHVEPAPHPQHPGGGVADPGPAGGGPRGKVIVNHNGHLISVNEHALKAHLEHGDTVSGSTAVVPGGEGRGQGKAKRGR
jgi:hypothetical protein